MSTWRSADPDAPHCDRRRRHRRGHVLDGRLAGSGAASDMGKNFVSEAVKKTEKVQADVSALLALDSKPSGLDTILEGQWA